MTPCQLLLLIGYKMTPSNRDSTKASVLTYHRIIEAFKFGYAWRSRLGDPRFNPDKKINQVSEIEQMEARYDYKKLKMR